MGPTGVLSCILKSLQTATQDADKDNSIEAGDYKNDIVDFCKVCE